MILQGNNPEAHRQYSRLGTVLQFRGNTYLPSLLAAC
jgi:hypothetical protein